MAVHGHTHGHRGFRLPVWRTTRTAPASGETAAAAAAVPAASAAARVLAGLRFATGFVFLWAFADKTFGLGYATPAERAWIEGGSPTEGFLSGVTVGPLESFFHDIAGAAWADWLFMLGLLGIGLALTAGVALRLTAVAGTVMMALMWAAEWPLAQHLSDGSPSMSTNPLVDYHVMYAAVMIVLAVAAAGDTWGLGRWWARLPLVRSLPWLR
ncbi:hypothetical protein [Streptomyces radiopugnans]|uniref:Thiosulfate dehydrogenase [quinone] large subunit n=1 Tax=Streptomyces radiopugnans TaxID=403935 RepID=A0A1H9BC12_9ACTN|nr:hypothetical protein [Streptomyces radiopugnans]SEP86203.1 thiosulfate dehydrogenase [quinone] large subunit [Streptomyces radiopugnans]